MWETILCNSLLEVIGNWRRVGGEDRWWWKSEETGSFMVSSTYKILENLLIPREELCGTKERVFGSVWKSLASTKVVAFSWQLLLDRIPTKLNLARRRVLPLDDSVNCVFCNLRAEISSHIFLHCQFAFKVWSKVLGWLHINL